MNKKVEEYLNKIDPEQRKELERVRDIVVKEVPEAEEVMSYGMPGFKYKGKYLCGFAAFKDHLSFFPTAGPLEDLQDRLDDYKLSKGTIQFTIEKPIKEALIKDLIENRISKING